MQPCKLRQKLRYLLVGTLVASCWLTLTDGQEVGIFFVYIDIFWHLLTTSQLPWKRHQHFPYWIPTCSMSLFQSNHLRNILMDEDYIATSFVDDCHNCGMASNPYACWNIDVGWFTMGKFSIFVEACECCMFLQQVPKSLACLSHYGMFSTFADHDSTGIHRNSGPKGVHNMIHDAHSNTAIPPKTYQVVACTAWHGNLIQKKLTSWDSQRSDLHWSSWKQCLCEEL